jgi:ribosomal-protein-alanine N-acetyltransferase
MNFKDLRGKRIFLKEVDLEILDDVHEYSTIPSFYEFLEFPPFKSLEDTKKYLKKLISRMNCKNAHYWSINTIAPKKTIGTIGVLNIDWRRMNGDFGYGLSPSHWGKGYATEAIGLVLGYLFSEPSFYKLSTMTHFNNKRSIKILEKFGLKKEGILKKYYLSYDGNRSDAFVYSILKPNYS